MSGLCNLVRVVMRCDLEGPTRYSDLYGSCDLNDAQRVVCLSEQRRKLIGGLPDGHFGLDSMNGSARFLVRSPSGTVRIHSKIFATALCSCSGSLSARIR